MNGAMHHPTCATTRWHPGRQQFHRWAGPSANGDDPSRFKTPMSTGTQLGLFGGFSNVRSGFPNGHQNRHPRADSRKLADSIRRYGRPERQAHGQRLSRNPHEDGDFQGTERRTCKRLRKFVRSTVVENDLCSPLRTSGQASSENDIFEGPALGIPLPWWWNGPANGAPRSTANLGVYRDMSVSPSGRSSPVGETCRYSVCRVMPSSVQRSLTFVSGLPMDAMASRSFAGVIL
jgi:hypothetical protein